MNKLTAASLKLHMFGVFVLQTLHAEGKLPEDFDPMSLDTSIVAKFDPNEMKNHFKTNKKTKTNVKVVSSPRENVVGVIANNHYESNQTDDVVMQIVNAAKSDVAEKPKRKPRQKKTPVESADEVAVTSESEVADTTEPVVEEKPKKKSPPKKKAAPAEPVVVETTDSSVAVETTEGFVEPQASAAKQNLDSTPRISAGNPVLNEPVVVEEKPKKKSPPKKKAATAEPVVVETTDSSVAVETTEPVVVEEKPKKKSPPKKKAATAEPVVVETTDSSVAVETTEGFVEPQASAAKQNLDSTPRISAGNPVLNEPAVVEEKPKKKSPPKKKAAPAETTEPAVVEEKPKKNAAIKAVKDLVSSVVAEKKEEIVEEPIAENKVEEPIAENKVEEPIAENKVEEANVTAEEEEDDDEDAEEIQARIMNYEGKQYLIDGDNNIYDKESFDELGTFNTDTQKIIFN